jgi:gluconate 2-dehydrogenase gamma chain
MICGGGNMLRREVIKKISLLLGGSLSAASQRALAEPRLSWSQVPPAYDSARQAIAHRLVDLIIPDTDTPGALQAGVPDFVDYVVSRWYRDAERQRFIQGLNRLQFAALEQHQSAFVRLNEERQVALLLVEEAGAGPAPANFGEGAFFHQIKELTVVGYYTSEIGATQELSYKPMPGRYDGAYKFSAVGRQWSS